jgi:hypothetical protein
MSKPIARSLKMKKQMGDMTDGSFVFGLPLTSDRSKQTKDESERREEEK